MVDQCRCCIRLNGGGIVSFVDTRYGLIFLLFRSGVKRLSRWVNNMTSYPKKSKTNFFQTYEGQDI